ncbi:hypothetical protein BHE74_00039061 [Ensete ventricosum]|nr:hypothetical protein BHE74_00039061 [Ensete ventricosum]RZS15573.1 hypothetical protein BHM03_00047434 [Ensete ventricosum]
MREGIERRKAGDGGAGEDAMGRFRPHLELIPREALRNAPAAAKSGANPAQGELSPAPLSLPPSAIVRKKTKMAARARRGSSTPTWAKTPFTINRNLLDHSSHDPFRVKPIAFCPTKRGPAPCRIPPDRVLLCVPPCLTPPSCFLHPTNVE